MHYLMSIKTVSARNGYHMNSPECTATDALKAVEKACAVRFPGTIPHDLVLRTDNGP